MSRVLLGVTGSVAAVKTPELLAALRAEGHRVAVLPTASARFFFDPGALQDPGGQSGDAETPPRVRGQSLVYLDADEWPRGRLFEVGEPVLHIELRKWAEALVIAPLDAHTLAKIALGLCDNLLTCVYRAWDPTRPLVLAPAMNTLMWEQPATARHLRQLIEDHGGSAPGGETDPLRLCEAARSGCPRLRLVPPVSKRLACGDEGMGGMAPVSEIVAALRELLR